MSERVGKGATVNLGKALRAISRASREMRLLEQRNMDTGHVIQGIVAALEDEFDPWIAGRDTKKLKQWPSRLHRVLGEKHNAPKIGEYHLQALKEIQLALGGELFEKRQALARRSPRVRSHEGRAQPAEPRLADNGSGRPDPDKDRAQVVVQAQPDN